MTEATRAASQRDWSRRSGVLVAADVLFPLLVFGAVKLAEGTDQYRRFVGEDGVLEWLQVAAFVFTAGLLVDLARRTRATTRRLAVGAALMVIVVIGEELAWGTRLFGSGAEVIQRHNEQGDTTLHNLGGGLETSFAAVTLVAVALGMLVLARRPPFHRVPISVVWWLVIPAVLRRVPPPGGGGELRDFEVQRSCRTRVRDGTRTAHRLRTNRDSRRLLTAATAGTNAEASATWNSAVSLRAPPGRGVGPSPERGARMAAGRRRDPLGWSLWPTLSHIIH